jgi:hypothetical protein
MAIFDMNFYTFYSKKQINKFVVELFETKLYNISIMSISVYKF